ncbi:MAG TPA: hypothetical protein VK603_11855, partial [Candidatus Saccharimonadales bacterium]|nr:hypothetical protein [Candidatus Saccharimonadales bacterium]
MNSRRGSDVGLYAHGRVASMQSTLHCPVLWSAERAPPKSSDGTMDGSSPIMPAGASLGKDLAQQSRRAGTIVIDLQKRIASAKRRQQAAGVVCRH